MRYESQKVALVYFAGALLLFVVQVLVGTLAGVVYVLPNVLSELVPFNILRMIHTNALIVWLLMGFFKTIPPDLEDAAEYGIVPDNVRLMGPMICAAMFDELKAFEVVDKLVEVHGRRSYPGRQDRSPPPQSLRRCRVRGERRRDLAPRRTAAAAARSAPTARRRRSRSAVGLHPLRRLRCMPREERERSSTTLWTASTQRDSR